MHDHDTARLWIQQTLSWQQTFRTRQYQSLSVFRWVRPLLTHIDSNTHTHACTRAHTQGTRWTLVIPKRCFELPWQETHTEIRCLHFHTRPAMSLFRCEQGTYHAEFGFPTLEKPCTPCPRSTYATALGSTACVECPPEHYTVYEGSKVAADCIKVQLGVDRITVVGRRIFMDVWFLSFPLAHQSDHVSVCKVDPPPAGFTFTEGEAADACRVLAWMYTSQEAAFSLAEPYLPGPEPRARGSGTLVFGSAGPGVHELRFFSHAFNAIVLSTFWETDAGHVLIAGDYFVRIETVMGAEVEIRTLPPDVGDSMSTADKPPYLFPTPRLNFERQIATSPMCRCANAQVDKHSGAAPWYPSIPNVCMHITCIEVSTCEDLAPGAFAQGVNTPLLRAVLSSAMGAPTLYGISCEQGWNRVLLGTSISHPSQRSVTCLRFLSALFWACLIVVLAPRVLNFSRARLYIRGICIRTTPIQASHFMQRINCMGIRQR